MKLNNKLKLAKNIFDNVEMLPIRDGYGHGLVELGSKNKNIIVLGADLTESTRTNWFLDKYPEQFFDIGIAEQNMMGIAAGLSLTGKIPFVSTYGVFCTGRAWDQLRTTVCYANLNVKIGSAHGGISVGADGATHQALEDVTLARVLPNMTVIIPTDAIEAKKATIDSTKINGPVFVRFGREKVPVITTEDTPFKVGKAEVYKDGKDVAVIACGVMVYEALIAAKKLEEEGISVRVINCHTVKPIDKKTLVNAAKECGAIVTAEEHQILAGFGSAVAEVIVQNHPVPMKMIGVIDRFGESGSPDDLMKAFGLTHKEIAEACREIVKLKK